MREVNLTSSCLSSSWTSTLLATALPSLHPQPPGSRVRVSSARGPSISSPGSGPVGSRGSRGRISRAGGAGGRRGRAARAGGAHLLALKILRVGRRHRRRRALALRLPDPAHDALSPSHQSPRALRAGAIRNGPEARSCTARRRGGGACGDPLLVELGLGTARCLVGVLVKAAGAAALKAVVLEQHRLALRPRRAAVHVGEAQLLAGRDRPQRLEVHQSIAVRHHLRVGRARVVRVPHPHAQRARRLPRPVDLQRVGPDLEDEARDLAPTSLSASSASRPGTCGMSLGARSIPSVRRVP